MQGDDAVYKKAVNKFLAVLICVLLVASSISTVYAVEYNHDSGICYIMPVYHNLCRIAEYNKQSLENEQPNSDNLWIKEDVNILWQDRMPDRLMPSAVNSGDVSKYTSMLHFSSSECSGNGRRMYHLLN